MDTYCLTVKLLKKIKIPAFDGGGSTDFKRDDFYGWIWNRFSEIGLLGVHEGTLLSEEATEKGFTEEAWTVDSGVAPPERDWVGQVAEASVELYFATEFEAQQASQVLKLIEGVQIGDLEKRYDQDWDAQWKASFLNNGDGVAVPPFWHIVPPWVNVESKQAQCAGKRLLKINPGAGFGTGTHETTQLCLQAIGEVSQRGHLSSVQRALDFGSGSGILAIGIALLGLQVDAVEVDAMAIENSLENAELNGVQKQVHYFSNLTQIPLVEAKYSLIVANILRPVLMEYAQELVDRLAISGILILSGLIEKDVELVLKRYRLLLGEQVSSHVYSLGDWRAISFVTEDKEAPTFNEGA